MCSIFENQAFKNDEADMVRVRVVEVWFDMYHLLALSEKSCRDWVYPMDKHPENN